MKVKIFGYGHEKVLVVIGNSTEYETNIEIFDLDGNQLVEPIVLEKGHVPNE